MAKGIKRGVEWALARLGGGVFGRYPRFGTAILAYHNIVPTGERACGVLSLHTDQVDFARQLEFLLESHDVVSLDEALLQPPTSRPRAVITFDDGYRGTMTAGLEELARRDLPGTVFVPPGLLGEAEGFWWDRLASDGRLDPALRKKCLVELQGKQETIVDWARQSRIPLAHMPDHGRICDEVEVLEAARRGVGISNHTWSHTNLTALDSDAAHSQVIRGKQWLSERLPAAGSDYLAYPYGLAGHLVRHAELGCKYGFLIDGGIARVGGGPGNGPLEIPRINVPRGLSLEGLTLRLLGWWR